MAQSNAAAVCKGVRVPASPFLNETRIKRMAEARYEGDEIKGALSVVRSTDRVLELGAGLGVVGAVIARNAKPEAVMSFEANPNLIPHINALYEENDLSETIRVRHEVVLSGPEQPETIDFHLRNSYLGSSLIDAPTRKTRKVSVPTVDFARLCSEFKPTVLVMDIEGGELDFLQHADLSSVRAVVVEFHPKLYGRRGMQACKGALRAAGFVKDTDVSTRLVWTAVRPEQPPRIAEPPMPDGGWSQGIRVVKHAYMCPAKTAALSAPSGVLDASGADVPEAALWRKRRRVNLPFDLPLEGDILPGTWLWAGPHWNNFAHLITEGVSRLWALEHLEETLNGIVFLQRKPGQRATFNRLHEDLFQTLGIKLPVKLISAPTRVDSLIVPGQGFGIGEISSGTPAFRGFMERRFGAEIAPEGGERLFISRARLGNGRGALLGEVQIENELANHGYEIFHPERHDFATQIARYKAARQVVAVEGSALHFLAHVGQTGQQVAVIGRRKSGATRHMLAHLESFIGTKPVYLDALRAMWTRKSVARARMAIGEPDMQMLQKALDAHGFIEAGADWADLDEAEVQSVLRDRYQSNLIAAE